MTGVRSATKDLLSILGGTPAGLGELAQQYAFGYPTLDLFQLAQAMVEEFSRPCSKAGL